MKIGYVLKKFPKLSETFVLNEMLALEAHGAEIEIFSMSLPDEPRFHAGVGALRASVHYLGAQSSGDVARRIAGDRMHFESAPGTAWSRVWDLMESSDRDPVRLVRHALELASVARELGIDRFHAHFAGPATEIARAAGALIDVPYSFSCHAKDIYHESVDRNRLFRCIDDADRVITVCEANRTWLEETAGRTLPQLELLYNGIDTSRFHPEHHAPVSRPLVLGVGRLVEKKGFVHLIESIAALVRGGRDVDCVIAGEGRERPRIESAIAEYGLEERIRLLGAVDTNEVAEWLTRAHVVALPCVIGADGNRDALPTVILEAMAAGVPVVSTPVAGVAEMLDDGRAGHLVPQRDAQAMADVIAMLLDDPEHARSIAGRARARVERQFDLKGNTRRLLDGFEARPTLDERVVA